MTDERNVRQFPLAEIFILLFFICVWDTCKIKSAFILSPVDRGWEGVRLLPNCLQKPRKFAFFLGNMRIFFCYFELLETKGVGECGDLKIVSRSQNMLHFYFARIPYSLYLLISVFKQFF